MPHAHPHKGPCALSPNEVLFWSHSSWFSTPTHSIKLTDFHSLRLFSDTYTWNVCHAVHNCICGVVFIYCITAVVGYSGSVTCTAVEIVMQWASVCRIWASLSSLPSLSPSSPLVTLVCVTIIVPHVRHSIHHICWCGNTIDGDLAWGESRGTWKDITWRQFVWLNICKNLPSVKVVDLTLTHGRPHNYRLQCNLCADTLGYYNSAEDWNGIETNRT